MHGWHDMQDHDHDSEGAIEGYFSRWLARRIAGHTMFTNWKKCSSKNKS